MSSSNIINNNPHNLEVGKEYFIKYRYCESSWEKVLIDRITKDGYPWGSGGGRSSGIVTDSYIIEHIKYNHINFKDFCYHTKCLYGYGKCLV
jgi:hypothetical protein